MNRRRLLLAGLALGCAPRPAPAQTPRPWAGVNLAGLEFNPRALPGRENEHYVAPRPEDLDYYAAQGFELIRLPFRWERLQPELGGGLAPSYARAIERIVDAAGRLGLRIVLDAHQFGRRREAGASHIIGESEVVTAERFAQFWGLVAQRFAERADVVFSLMNEPHGQDSEALVHTQNAAIAAIRSAGSRHLVLASGAAWSGAHSWVSSGNARRMLSIHDPAGNLGFDVHQYLDRDSSGRSVECVSGAGAARLQAFTGWARAHGKRGFLGEVGVGRNPGCREELRALLGHVRDNADVWLGWAYWAGGPWWGEDYEFSIEPARDAPGSDRAQLDYLRPFLR